MIFSSVLYNFCLFSPKCFHIYYILQIKSHCLPFPWTLGKVLSSPFWRQTKTQRGCSPLIIRLVSGRTQISWFLLCWLLTFSICSYGQKFLKMKLLILKTTHSIFITSDGIYDLYNSFKVKRYRISLCSYYNKVFLKKK